MCEDEADLVGDYDPQLEELLKRSKKDKLYFNRSDEESKSHIEQISDMEEDPVMLLLSK